MLPFCNSVEIYVSESESENSNNTKLEIAWQCGPSVLISLSLSLSLSLYNSISELRILKWLGMVLLHNSVTEV